MVVFGTKKNAKTLTNSELADNMTAFLGKGAATRCCVQPNSKLYAQISCVKHRPPGSLVVTYFLSTRLDGQVVPDGGGDMNLEHYKIHFFFV